MNRLILYSPLRKCLKRIEIIWLRHGFIADMLMKTIAGSIYSEKSVKFINHLDAIVMV